MAGTLDKNYPAYAVRKWRNIPETTIEALDDFLSWLEYDSDSPDTSTEELKEITILVNAYLGRDMKKVQAGEKEMLEKWTTSARL